MDEWPPRDVCPLMPGACELHGIRGIAAVGIQFVKQLDLTWGVILDYPDGPNVVTRVLERGRDRRLSTGAMPCESLLGHRWL